MSTLFVRTIKNSEQYIFETDCVHHDKMHGTVKFKDVEEKRHEITTTELVSVSLTPALKGYQYGEGSAYITTTDVAIAS